MNVKLMLNEKTFTKKPNGFEIVKFQGYTTKGTGEYHPPTVIPVEIDIKDLAIGLCNGMTCKPALLSGSKSEDWIQQQVFMLDFDHDTTIQEQLDICANLGIKPAFGYASFSHSEKEHHFRLAFVTDEIITDINKRNKLQKTLIGIFSKSDAVTYDPTRLFFGGGGKYPIIEDYETRINGDDIINRFYKDEFEFKTKAKKKTNKEKKNLSETKNVFENKEFERYMDNVNSIRDLDVEGLQKLIGLEHDIIQISSEQEVYDYINDINMCEFLNLDEEYKINCILPNHSEKEPSASIWTMRNGQKIYKCFGCGTALTIIGLVENLAQCKRSQAIEFIKSVYGIELLSSEWVKEQQELMRQNALYLDTEEFKLQFPNITKLIRTRKHHIQLMLLHFTAMISEGLQVNGIPVFYGSYKKLMQVCSCKNKNMMSQSLTLFTLLNMLTKLEIENIPKKELATAQKISKKYGFKKLTSFYQFGEYGCIHLNKSEEIAKNLVMNNITMKGLSREYVLRTFDKELADKVYPQYKRENELFANRNNSNQKGIKKIYKSDSRTIEIIKFIKKEIERHGFVRERDIKANRIMEIQWRRSIQEILDSYGLVKIKASASNKRKYGIVDTTLSYQSNIIVQAL